MVLASFYSCFFTVSVPSVSSTNSDLSYSNLPSVQSFSDEALMAPPSVASVASVASTPMTTYLSSPPPTPCSSTDDFLRSPPSVAPTNNGMDTEESNRCVVALILIVLVLIVTSINSNSINSY